VARTVRVARGGCWRRTRLEICEVAFRTVDVLFLGRLVPAAEQDQERESYPGEIHTISRPPIDSELDNAASDRLVVAEVAERDSSEPGLNPRARLSVGERLDPLCFRPPVW